ncbi:MAG: helicase-related protein [Planctomycetota bacterium]|nr:helicase-related protein [Planctomycetota bacterium]
MVPGIFPNRILRYVGGFPAAFLFTSTGPVLFSTLLATKSGRFSSWRSIARGVDSRAAEFEALSDRELRKTSLALRYRVNSGESLDRILPEAFALVREAGRRFLSMRHYDVQILGGIALHHGCIAEMQTGEGKTLTATLPLYLAALTGNGAHLATANDYLAGRDAELMGPLYRGLGVSVGVVQSQTPRPQRQKAYQADITYSTAKELGFDFLRDRLLLRRIKDGSTLVLDSLSSDSESPAESRPVQRELNYVIVDEADSILIDEARTPLIVSSMPGGSEESVEALYRWSAKVASQFIEETHFEAKQKPRQINLNEEGRKLLRSLKFPPELDLFGMLDIYEQVERAILVAHEYQKDRHYVVRDDEIVIVDEFTGRLAEGRKWRAGIHQAIEAREQVPVSVETGDAAKVTIQDFFLRYDRLAGMTGTAATSAVELHKIYGTRVAIIPTNRPPRRIRQPDQVYGNSEAKWSAIVEEIVELNSMGRPVLVGTRSIDKSEYLSQKLKSAGVEHLVLNARHTADENQIVAQAGQLNRVTVATNMAGRGTDIQPTEDVLELGGLHVICTEMHDSARIDRQLIGRCGRQGDPGSFQIFLSLDDDILREGHGLERYKSLVELGNGAGERFDSYAPLFRKAQNNIERKHFKARKQMLYVDKQRRKIQVQMGQDPFLESLG